MKLILVLGVVYTLSVVGANIYHEGSKIMLIPNKKAGYFGYSVLIRNTFPIQIVVGAPKASDGDMNPGTVYICELKNFKSSNGSNTVICTELELFKKNTAATKDYIKNDMWLGSTLAELNNGTLIIGAPRWFMPYRNSHYLLNGVCFSISPNTGQYLALAHLSNLSKQAFMTDGKRKEYGEHGLHLNYFAYGQTGFSMATTEDKNIVLLGAPGVMQWTGSVTVLDTRDNRLSTPNPYDINNIGPDEYFGYSVDTGVFTIRGKTLFVGSAPRSKSGLGQVLIFDVISSVHNSPVRIHSVLVGTQLGAYFGASLCVVDLNNDGISDLLVGASTFVDKADELPYDQGAVFVYIAQSNRTRLSLVQQSIIQGSKQNGARFGTSITSIGDVDGDGYNDIAIGAPFEDNGIGAVYIYRSTKKGLLDKFSQRIIAEKTRGFGFSISKTLDIDKNGCNDLAIGAYESENTFIYKCIPTIKLETSIRVPDAMDLPQNSTNFKAIFCVKVEKRSWPHIKIDLQATVIVDREATRATIPDDPKYVISAVPSRSQVLCEEKEVNVNPHADLSKPISILFHVERIKLIDEDSSLVLPQNLVRLSEDSVLHSSFNIQLTRDCGEDLICHPELEMTMTAFSLSEKLGAKVTIKNIAEPAYGFQVNLTLPVVPIRTPSLCRLDKLNMTCSVPSPLHRNEVVFWDIELEYNKSHSLDEHMTYQMRLVATLLEPFEFKKRNSSTVKELILKVTPRSNITVVGKTITNNTILVSQKTYNEEKFVNFIHFFEITNYGPSGWPLLIAEFIFTEVSVSQSSNNVKDYCKKSLQKLHCGWGVPANLSIPVVLQFRLNLTSQGKLVETGILNVTTLTVVSVGQNNITANVTTTFILEPAPPIWPIILGIIFGFILLTAITYLLFKYGFFSRQRREDLKRLKESANEASTSENIGVENETSDHNDSSEELLEESRSD